MNAEREVVAAALAEHSMVATGLGEWACKCSPMEWRPTAFRPQHLAAAVLPLLAAAREEGRAKGAAEGAELRARVEAEIDHAEMNEHALDPNCQGVAPGERVPAVRADYLRAALAPDAPTAAPSGGLSDGEGSGGTPGHRDGVDDSQGMI